MHHRRWWPSIVVVVSLLLCCSGMAMAQTPKQGGMLRVAYGNEIAHPDFHTAPGYEMQWVAMNVGCGLVNITPDGQFVGDAAQSWEVAPDGLSYTLPNLKCITRRYGWISSCTGPGYLWEPPW